MAGVKIDAAVRSALVAKYSYGGGGQPVIPNMAEWLDAILATIEAGELGAGTVGTAEIAVGAVTDDLIASKIVKDPGRLAVGLVTFGAKGDCTSVRMGGAGAIAYAYAASPTVTLGQWAYGADAPASATNLAAGINGDTRNSGGPYYKAVVSTNTVFIFQLTPGDNPTMERVGGAQPATVEGMGGGGSAEVKQTAIINHIVTTQEAALVEVQIPLPFTPLALHWFVRSAAGALKTLITDVATIEATPPRIKVATAGAVHIAATDVIVVIAQS